MGKSRSVAIKTITKLDIFIQVNTASRMESSGQPRRVQASEATHTLLRKHHANHASVSTELRGTMDVKGKGEMQTYWLVDLREIKES